MSDELIIAPGEDDAFVELSRTPTGKLFKKHILSVGPLYHSSLAGGKVDIDEQFLNSVVRNFNDHVVGHVQAPVVDSKNRHTEDPWANVGEVVKMEVENGKAYAYVDVRDEVAAKKIGKTLLGASATLSTNHLNTKTNKHVGPTIVQMAITNNPHVNDLDDFEEVIALSAGSSDSTTKAVLVTAAPTQKKKGSTMDLDELIAVARDEHGIDIPELQKAASKADSFTKLSADLQSTLAEGDNAVLNLSAGDEASAEDLVSAVADLVQSRVELSAKVDTLVQESATSKAEARIEELVAGGYIVPAKRAENLELLLSNAELFERLVPEKPVVDLSSEQGQEVKDSTHDETIQTELARLSADAAAEGLIKL